MQLKIGGRGQGELESRVVKTFFCVSQMLTWFTGHTKSYLRPEQQQQQQSSSSSRSVNLWWGDSPA